MTTQLVCYRCGASLAALTPPLSRRDLCPECSTELHVCRMCQHFDPGVPKQCREDDAEEVFNKDNANFCDWFQPRPDAFDPSKAGDDAQARAELASLFGDTDDSGHAETDASTQAAEDLFKK